MTDLKSQLCVIGCLKSTCRALRSPCLNSSSTFPSQHAPSNPSTATFYQLVSCGGSNHPITLYVPQLRCISILVMVVLATAAMVTRQVGTGGVSKVAAQASKWKEMVGGERSRLYQEHKHGARQRQAGGSLVPKCQQKQRRLRGFLVQFSSLGQTLIGVGEILCF